MDPYSAIQLKDVFENPFARSRPKKKGLAVCAALVVHLKSKKSISKYIAVGTGPGPWIRAFSHNYVINFIGIGKW